MIRPLSACHSRMVLRHHTYSHDVLHGMLLFPLGRTHVPMTSGLTCHHRPCAVHIRCNHCPWTAHTVRQCYSRRASMLLGLHTWSNDVDRGSTHCCWTAHTIGLCWACHAIIAPWAAHTVGKYRSCHPIFALRKQI